MWCNMYTKVTISVIKAELLWLEVWQATYELNDTEGREVRWKFWGLLGALLPAGESAVLAGGVGFNKRRRLLRVAAVCWEKVWPFCMCVVHFFVRHFFRNTLCRRKKNMLCAYLQMWIEVVCRESFVFFDCRKTLLRTQGGGEYQESRQGADKQLCGLRSALRGKIRW